ncbi:acetate--CoA ligase [Crocinitomix algicola]|uniref:acetate--CoA ligase n=1 Tax=Crocinitomix algicola TaxID=1740263 RepID=UPI00082C72EA|nr:acetate--CoA ligase [Crocinitomix algicola]
MKYKELYNESITNPAEFWKRQANQLKWHKHPKKIITPTETWNNWFEDGKLNMSYLCIDYHIENGRGNDIAIYYDSPVTKSKQKITYTELLYEVGTLADSLLKLGIRKGDTVIIYMPMIPQAIYAMLACARIGAIHSVVFGGFAPNELAIRIDDCKPKLIITASHGIEVDRVIPYKPFVDEAIHLAEHKVDNVIIYNRQNGLEYSMNEIDLDYETLVNDSEVIEAKPVKSTHPLYILYTSGTTGTPKGVIRDTGGYATALKFSMKYVYGVKPGETFWAASDVGWVVGHSFIVYGPLLNGNSTVLFEGKPIRTPDASTFWRIISEYNVVSMFTAPTAIRAIRKEDPLGSFIKQYDLSKLRHQFLAGERCDASTLNWLENQLKIPVIDHWWQTESGWPMLANFAGIDLFSVKPGSAGKPVCGYRIEILNNEGENLGPNEEGLVAVKLPLPPGNLMNLWRNPKRFNASYLNRFPGYYFTGDGGYKDEDGYVFITGRVDDIINVAGHRLSTAEMEEIVASHPKVAECAVFGVHCDIKGQKPLGLIVLSSSFEGDEEEVKKQIIQSVRNKIGAVASFKEVKIVKRLPKTRSGKILRKLLRQIADHQSYKIPSTIDDVTIIKELEQYFVN